MLFSTQSWIGVALSSLVLLPSLISAQSNTADGQTPRSFFTTISDEKSIYILGGSNTTLDVRYINMTNGVDINNVNWYFWSAPKSPALSSFSMGVAYPSSEGSIYVQGGVKSTSDLENIMEFYTTAAGRAGQWSPAPPIGNPPPATAMMSASYNPVDATAYYYGGQPLRNHALDSTKPPLSTFSAFNTKTRIFNQLTPASPANKTRPGRVYHSSNLINNQVFIMGGQTYGANSNSTYIETDFQSVLVYDIKSNTAMSVTTLGDVPAARQSFSTALGLDGHSIVMYGGCLPGKSFTPASSDVYILDTCTLTWSKKSPGGTSPGSLFAHGAVTVNNYMVVTLGQTDLHNYNRNTFILDMSQWKWVNTLTNTASTIASSTCQFKLPDITSTNFVPFNYDYGVLANPATPASNVVNKKGFGIGFGLFAVILIAAAVYFYIRRTRRKKARTLNPRWMRNVPANNGPSNDRDYPLFVYNKELDNDNINNPNRTHNAFAQNDVRTYTASDHEQWEHQLNKDAEQTDNGLSSRRHSDIWQRMRGLNDAAPEQEQRNNGKLLDV